MGTPSAEMAVPKNAEGVSSRCLQPAAKKHKETTHKMIVGFFFTRSSPIAPARSSLRLPP